MHGQPGHRAVRIIEVPGSRTCGGGEGVKGLEEDGLECRRCLAGYWILKSKKLERKGD